MRRRLTPGALQPLEALFATANAMTAVYGKGRVRRTSKPERIEKGELRIVCRYLVSIVLDH